MGRQGIQTWLEADLIVDTAGKTRPAGTRRRGSRRRQLLFRAGNLYIDLRLDGRSGTRDRIVLGQVVEADASSDRADRAVALSDEVGNRISARTDSLGEFMLTGELEGALTLDLDLGEELGIKLPIPSEGVAVGVVGDRR